MDKEMRKKLELELEQSLNIINTQIETSKNVAVEDCWRIMIPVLLLTLDKDLLVSLMIKEQQDFREKIERTKRIREMSHEAYERRKSKIRIKK